MIFKKVGVAITATLLAVSLAACGGNEEKPKDVNTPAATPGNNGSDETTPTTPSESGRPTVASLAKKLEETGATSSQARCVAELMVNSTASDTALKSIETSGAVAPATPEDQTLFADPDFVEKLNAC